MGVLAYGLDDSDRFFELENYVNARTSALFRHTDENVQTQLAAGVHGEIITKKHFDSGNWGLKVKVDNGPEAGKEYWVYFNENHPAMNLFKERPADWEHPEPAAQTTDVTQARLAQTTRETRAILEGDHSHLTSTPQNGQGCTQCQSAKAIAINARALSGLVHAPPLRADQIQHTADFIGLPHQPPVENDKAVSFIDLSKDWGVPRFFLTSTDDKGVLSTKRYQTTHGRQFPNRKDQRNLKATKLGDSPGSNMTAPGCYVTGKEILKGSFPIDDAHPNSQEEDEYVELFGAEATNQNAHSRGIFVHCWSQVNDKNASEAIVTTKGCFALDRKICHGVLEKIKGGSVLCALK